MRLLIYLLALMSGFSAAEAARTEIGHASTVAQSAVATAEALASQDQISHAQPSYARPQNQWRLAEPVIALALVARTPVTRRDLALQ